MEGMVSQPTTLIGIAAVVVTSITMLVVWIVKFFAKGQREVTDRYFGHLERRDEDNRKAISMFSDSLEKVNANLDEHTKILRGVVDRQETSCKYRKEHPQS